MAWFSLDNVVILCIFLLSSLPASFQICPSSGFYFQDNPITEGPDTLDHVLGIYGNNAITNLTLTDDANGYLAINVTSHGGQPTNFTLYIAKVIDLETLKKDTLDGKIVCADENQRGGYRPSDVIVPLLSVNDFPPQFKATSFTTSVSEDTRVGSTVFDLSDKAVDTDFPPANQILYKIHDSSSPFSMTNGHLVILDRSLDYESGPLTYNLNVSAEELQTSPPPKTSYATLTILITDVDDLGPRFSHNATYTLALPEGVYSDAIFNTDPAISARDGDSLNDPVQLQLDPTSEALADRFTLLSNGSLQVKGTFEPGKITINIRAFQTNRSSDRFAIASVGVTVYDVNDHSPQMSSDRYTASVSEAAGSGTVVLAVSASDGDKGINSSFQFHLNDSSVPFSISTQHTVGIITVNGSLDREMQQSYLLHVYAQEDQTGEQRRSNVSEVSVTVLDVNDHSPVFQGQPYQFSLNETDINGTFVGQVNATDADSKNNGQIVFSITAQDSNIFAVDPTTGVITLTSNLTQQDVGVVLLDVKADDNAPVQSRRSQSARVIVTILAVNQHPPKFSSASYNFTVTETAQKGLLLGAISATDEDNDLLEYWLVNSQNEPLDFKLEGKNPARLLVNGSVDLDVAGARAERTLQAVVSDGTFRSSASVTVTVTPVNEHPPVLAQAHYLVSVQENDTRGDAILTIIATDGDSGADGDLRFAITSPVESERGPFAINATSGVLSLLHCNTTCLSYSLQQQYTLVVRVTDGGSPSRSAYCTVRVEVEDVNNQAPYFSPATILGTVSEDAPSGTTVLRLYATDEDTLDSQLVYSLIDVTPAGWLVLSGTYLLTNGALDAETAQHITATVTVSDGVQMGTGVLNVTVLDVNDNHPQITLPSNPVDIPENVTVGTSVLSVTAHDRDVTQGGSFLFYFGSSPSGKFAINSSTGEITVAARFDRRLQKEYDVTVTVSDNSAPPKMNSTTLHVVITDSNSAPVFVDSVNTLYSFNVSEEEPVGFVLGSVRAVDPDSGSSGQVLYNISSGNREGTFHLDEDTGQLLLQKRLDFEQRDSYSFTVTATDNSYEPKHDSATVWVHVVDIVEAPQWPETLPTVHLTANKRCEDMQLNARPQDILHTASKPPTHVVYSLLNHTDLFLIHNDTGMLQRKGDLAPGTYVLGLRACSELNESVCSDTVLRVIVFRDDVITFCPPFLTVHVNESEPSGHVVVDMNSTSGDTNTTYSLTDSSKLHPFAIDEFTGIITVNGTLDRERTPRYTLDVVVHYPPSGSAAAQVTVVIDDTQDNPPSFQLRRYDGQISEAAIVGDPVLTLPSDLPLIVVAEDRDLNSVLTYSIVPDEDNSRGAFSVNATTGLVTLERTIDRENMTANLTFQYTMTVMVTDGLYSDNTTVVITVLNDNDNSPVFDPDVLTFNVSEAAQPPFTVAHFTATDLDEGDTKNLRYTLLSSHPVPFAVSRSGVLQLTHRLDRENVSSYSFTVQATDPGNRNGTAQVDIHVIDANEAPYFEKSTYVFNVTEGPDGLQFEGRVRAVDGDLGTNADLTFRIVDGNQASAFTIATGDNATTGVLRVVKELDREETASLTLTVIATDAGHPSLTGTCRVEVKVVDVNDHDPAWGRDRYKAVVSESASNNTPVTLIPEASVSDADEGAFGVEGVVYSLDPSYPEVPFRVDAATGHIFVAFFNGSDHLDREVRPSYTLMLEARDAGGQGRRSNTTVVIHLLNINDHPPTFSQPLYRFNVSENVPVGRLVGRLYATDSDNDFNGNSSSSGSVPVDITGGGVLRFYLHPPGGGFGLFYLEPVSGELRVSGPLDREIRDRYVLSLGVYDGLFWGNATAEITVDDVNDDCPDFNAHDPLTLRVMENQDPHVIYNFNVTDSDAGSNADVTMFINDTDAKQYLGISANGTLRTTRRLDREKADQQTLTFSVWARDGGDPACVTSLRVRLEVEGANEVTPEVCQITPQHQPVCGHNVTVTAFHGDFSGTFLAALTWRDSDEGEGGQATLSVEEDPEGLLTFNHSSTPTSLLTLARPLNRTDLALRGRLGEDNSTYRAVVRAEDGGGSPRNSSVVLLLRVLPLSPTMPVFSTSVYHFSVRENQPATVVGRVKASAQSNQLSMTYILQSADFSVDSMGNISTRGELDRERKDQYTFLVLAKDSSQPSETATTVVLVHVTDVNDNPPVFSAGPRYALTVPENLKGVSLMTFTATDRDAGLNGEVTFTLLNSSFDGLFVLNETSGQLWLNQSLDRETKSSYILHVQAQDGGAPVKSSQAILELTVKDLNDNDPVFSEPEYVGYVDEKAPAATLVKKVDASDVDSGLNGQVLYELVTDDTSSNSMPAAFFINEFTGAIYTARSLHFRAEQTFNLTVRARDLGTPPLSSDVLLRVFVNDLTSVLPRVQLLPHDTLALVLGTPAGTPLPVNVSGGSGLYNFTFVGGNEEGMFAIDSESGEVTVVKEVSRVTTYTLTIRVLNLQATQYHADATLTVLVTSVKLEQEQYAAVAPENRPPPFLLLDISSNAERAGVPVIYRINGEGIAGVFSIGAGTGHLYCNQTLDRERRSEYTMTVSVQLTNAPPSAGRRRRALSNVAEIRVIVDDVNDNPPNFDVTSNVFGIPRAAPAYTVVTTLKAKDPDAGTNGEIAYTVTGGDTNIFYVTADGKVTSLEAMTGRKSGEQFRLVVNATDNGGVCGSSGDKCHKTRIEIKIVVVPNSDRFGLVANITVNAFLDKQQVYLRNLSDILNMTLQLDKVEPHQGSTIDTSRSDIYFYAFDKDGKPIPYTTVNERVTKNADAIHALLRLKSVQLIPVTQPPTRVRVETRTVMGEAEVAVIVVASLIFLGSFVAIILTIKAWKKQKEFQRREEAAVWARQKLEQEAKELADKIQETSFVADPEEPLELDMDPEDEGRVFNPRMFLKNMRESEYGPAPAVRPVVTEVQEIVVDFDNESTGVDTLLLRHDVLRRTEAMELRALMSIEENPPHVTDSGTENNTGSLSSGEHLQVGSGLSGNGPSGNGPSGSGPSGSGPSRNEPSGSGPSTSRAFFEEISKVLSTTGQEESRQSSTGKSPTVKANHVSSPSSSVDRSAKLTGSAPNWKTSSTHDNKLGTPERAPKLLMNKKVTSKTPEIIPTEKVPVDIEKTENRIDKPQNGTVPKESISGNSQDIKGSNPDEDIKMAVEDDRLEDPEPDYQKRVSFGNVLDAQKDSKDIKEKTSNQTSAPSHNSQSPNPTSGTKVTMKDLQTEPGSNYLSATSNILNSLRARKLVGLGMVNPAYEANGDVSAGSRLVKPDSKADSKVPIGLIMVSSAYQANGDVLAGSRLVKSDTDSEVPTGLGVINPIYQADGDDVLEGWADDYDIKARASPRVSTAL